MNDSTVATESTSTEAPDGAGTAEAFEPTAEDYAALEAEMSTNTDESGNDAEAQPDTTDDSGDVAKARQQAARYRARLRETETERDQLRDQLASQRRAVIDWRAANAPTAVDAALLDAAGIKVDDLLDENGQLDMTAVDEFIDSTAKRFRIASGFRVNRAQGQAGNGGDIAPKSTLADVFRR